MNDVIFLDCEVYSNYFMVSFLSHQAGTVKCFELYDGHPFEARAVAAIMNKYLTASFNGNNFDLPLLAAAIQGFKPLAIKRMCDAIILGRATGKRIAADHDVNVPNWDHIDLIEVAPGIASLKIYGGRLGAPKLQDLPIEPTAAIGEADREALRAYCVNDLRLTQLLYESLVPQLAIRKEMSAQYNMDLRSKSDAQIAEAIIVSELTKITGKDYRAPKLPDNYAFRYRDPGFITFDSPDLQGVFRQLLKERFTLLGNGSVKMPDWLKDKRISLNGAEYQMGIGGLHSCEKRQYVEAEAGFIIEDRDVASYYPSIILQQNLAPATLGAPFLTVYRSLVERRLKAKREGDKTAADTLKIAINGSYGKLGSKYSALYSPDLMIQTTLTGQLCLLMLIERMGRDGVRVLSANTDGIVLHYPESLRDTVEMACFDWELDTGFTLEATRYNRIASRDVNNYVAVKPDGKAKGKGIFAKTGLSKNPGCAIVQTAVARFITDGTPTAQTIRDCPDILQFCTVRAVKGGAVWEGEVLGKSVRFYHSSAVPSNTVITYALNGYTVPKSAGCRPLMDNNGFPDDVDYHWYDVEAEKLLVEVGAL